MRAKGASWYGISLRWRLILGKHGRDIEYIKGKNNIATDGLSRITLNGNQETTQKSTYQQKKCNKSMTSKKYLKIISL